MSLTDAKAKSAKPQAKEYKLADGGGLYLLVRPNGAKYWRLKYRYAGKEKKLSIGVYPAVSLKTARSIQDQAKAQLLEGKDPSQTKRLEKTHAREMQANSFGQASSEWFAIKMAGKSDSHKERNLGIVNNHLSTLNNRPIAEITAPELLEVLRAVEKHGTLNTAHRALQIFGQIARFSIAAGVAKRDVSADLKGILKTPTKTHFAAITKPDDVGKLMLAIHAYEGSLVVMAALKISPLLLARPGEIRHMEWSEVDFDNALWTIPADKMKMKADHVVPLSTQALLILKDIHRATGRGRYVFPSARGGGRPMSENAVRIAIRSAGYDKEQMTAHGFRAMGRTLLDEALGYRLDYIEQQLAHAVRDSNGRAYNRTKHLEARREMMQAWANYLDSLRVAAEQPNVVLGKFKGR